MNACHALIAEKLRFAGRLVSEARTLLGPARLDPDFSAALLAVQEALVPAMRMASDEAGPDYAEQLRSFGHRRGAIPLGDLIARVLQMDLAHLEALAVDSQFLHRDVAQKAVELRALVDGRFEYREPAEPQPEGKRG